MVPSAEQPVVRRLRREGVLLSLGLGVVALLLVLELIADRGDVVAAERARINIAMDAVASKLVQQLGSAQAALRGVSDEAAQGASEAQNPRLRLLVDVIPGLRTIRVLDLQGRVLASSRKEPAGTDFSDHPGVREVLAQPQPQRVLVSSPYPKAEGLVVLNLAVSVRDAAGLPQGVVTATLDPEFFRNLLVSELYAPGMTGAVAHGNGAVLLQIPEGRPSAAEDATSLVAQRHVQPPALGLSDPLVLTLARPIADIEARWRQQAVMGAVLWLLLAATSVFALRRLQRHDRDAALRQRERDLEREVDAERLELALAGADLALWDLDIDSGRCTVNQRWYDMLGEPPASTPSDAQAWHQRIHPDDRDAVRAQVQAHQAADAAAAARYVARYRVRHASGEWIWLLDQGRVVERHPDGRARRMVGTHMDVTASHRAEEVLRQREEATRGLLESLLAGVVRHGPDTAVLSANPAACRILGASLEQMVGRKSPDLAWHIVDADGRPMALSRLPVNRVLAEGGVVEGSVIGIVHPDRDETTWLLVNAFPVHGEGGDVAEVVVTFVDISDLQRVQQRLRLFEAAIERLDDTVLITEAQPLQEPGPRIVFVNPAFERTTGWPAAQVLGRSPRLLQGPLSDRAELARIRDRLSRGEPVRSEIINYHREGHPYWVELEIVPLRNEAGALTHFVGLQRDVSERKAAQARLQAAQQDLAATLEAVPDLLFEVDAGGIVHAHHSPRRELLLVAPEMFLHRHFSEFTPPAAAAVVQLALAEALAQGHSQGRQYELALPDGPRWFELSVARKAMPDDQPARVIMLARDITDRQLAEAGRLELERRLAAAQKMESINTLAGGIAHEFNNLVPAILGNVAMARDDLEPGHPAQPALLQIQRAALRARALVQQILDFSRSRPPQLKVQALQPVIDETLALLRTTLPPSVRLDGPASGAAFSLRCDATQLQQVLMNLCINAWHALPDGRGHIEVGVAVEPAAAAPPLLAAAATGAATEVLHLWVRDDGAGIDDATRQRMFEPFFTTKPVGQGTGLGLSVAQALVVSHGGCIDVQSRPGAGTTFHLWFPGVAEPLADEADAEQPLALRLGLPLDGAAAPDAAREVRHVVYIDDDEVMRPMVEGLLQRLGHRVTACESAERALAYLQASTAKVDVVVSDFHMPEISGLELAERILRRWPTLPLVITTGHVTPELEAGARRAGVRAVMRKENTLEELGPLLQRVLDDLAV